MRMFGSEEEHQWVTEERSSHEEWQLAASRHWSHVDSHMAWFMAGDVTGQRAVNVVDDIWAKKYLQLSAGKNEKPRVVF